MISIRIIYYILSFLAVTAGIYMLFTKSLLRAAMSLLLIFLMLAGIYAISAAEFVAMTQILVYIGGLIVLLLFALLLNKQNKLNEQDVLYTGFHNLFFGISTGIGTLTLLIIAIIRFGYRNSTYSTSILERDTITQIGMSTMTDFIVPFELIAILLLIVLIAAVFITGKEEFTKK